MCELLESRERRASYAEVPASRARTGAATSDKGTWAAIWALIALLLGSATLAVLAIYRVDLSNRPSDEELTANFFSHETTFNELVQMLDADQRTLAPEGKTSIDFATLSRLSASAARAETYSELLRAISVVDLHYFPDSGKLILLPDRQANLQRPSKSYLYLPHAQPQPVVGHLGYHWRGPGVYVVTEDRPLTGSWFIRCDTMIQVAFSPY
jgi:hypothetical protein